MLVLHCRVPPLGVLGCQRIGTECDCRRAPCRKEIIGLPILKYTYLVCEEIGIHGKKSCSRLKAHLALPQISRIIMPQAFLEEHIPYSRFKG
ncbi:MAG: hypothetical protein ACE5I5_13155, partial [Candidatus Heimdallarchaeota archaeon]